MMVRMTLMATVALMLLAGSGVLGCGKWVASTPAQPVPSKAYAVHWANYQNYSSPMFYCSCPGGAGTLNNIDNGEGPGYKCWFPNNSTGQADWCATGTYKVLTTDFPYYSSDIKPKNSSATMPVGSTALPAPTATAYPGYSCVMSINNPTFGFSGQAIPGGLNYEPNSAQYICQVATPIPTMIQSTTVFSASTGQYAIISGDACNL
ncbi:uncharacterized protein MONBRDRAFT_6490 [Monosiga brevicollis MX1]|uniref:Fibronectin type-II domain-containing protein n=1 Tax=Monosiga brevicollis TaxID=81824 RepID=A9UU14_MONBE|nr:uncharacterized protein MONBRDRAFT_6490 [Monosiga brevicollis MX1]EDQ91342.1 predicted protein [Monosiga brevicollis MX1]|eukprot:XP_001743764.1 hypothetical protein [Monosiga brevicollis MX1]